MDLLEAVLLLQITNQWFIYLLNGQAATGLDVVTGMAGNLIVCHLLSTHGIPFQGQLQDAPASSSSDWFAEIVIKFGLPRCAVGQYTGLPTMHEHKWRKKGRSAFPSAHFFVKTAVVAAATVREFDWELWCAVVFLKEECWSLHACGLEEHFIRSGGEFVLLGT